MGALSSSASRRTRTLGARALRRSSRGGLARWVLLACTATVLLVAGFGVTVGVTVAQLAQAQQRQTDWLGGAQRADDQMLQAFVDEETGLRGYLLTREPIFLAPYEQAQQALPVTMQRFNRHFAAAGGPPRLAADLQQAHDAWLRYAHQQIELVDTGQLDQARSMAATAEGKQLFDTIRARNTAVTSWLTAASATVGQRVTGLQHRLVTLLVISLTALLGLVVVGCVVAWTAVARPLSRLAAATRSVAGGDLHAELPVAGAAEVRSLARDVEAMRDRLTADLHAIERSLEALEQTGPAVAALRVALEPSADTVPGVTVAARLDPAEGVLAGDWYDAVRLGPTRLAVVLGDVAGHGPASAVFALRLKHSLITALRAGLSPGQTLTEVSSELEHVPPGQFATVLVAVIDTATHSLTYANAGHPAGLLVADPPELGSPIGSDSDSRLMLLPGDRPVSWRALPSTGPLLSSVVMGWAWNNATRSFRPGDSLLAFTDGVLETRDEQGHEFGTTGILDTVVSIGLDDGDRLVDAIAAASMRFGGNRPRRDDHTVVHVRRHDDRAARRSARTSADGLSERPAP